ncbi:MAG: hypothetical protein AAGK38_06585 [Pseudomonadota bacterium]
MKKTLLAMAAAAAVMLPGAALADGHGKTKACFIYIGPAALLVGSM